MSRHRQNKMSLKQSSGQMVTLRISRSDLSLLLCDAAKSMNGNTEPLRNDVLRLAKEMTDHENIYNPDSSLTLLEKDILGIFADNEKNKI